MVIVTGLGRSGTSIIARFIKEIGYDIGKVRWSEKNNAGMESDVVVAINRALFKDIHRRGKVGPHLVRFAHAIRKVRSPVIKDPRFTYPGILQAWHFLRNDIKLLICHRRIEQVFSSGMKINTNWRGKKSSLFELKKDFAEFMTDVFELQVSYRVLFFPYFLQDYDSVFFAFKDLGIKFSYKKGKRVWEKLVDLDKVHF